ncbi:MAG: site-2 protease family protein [Balneolaceae bacterium]
MSASLNLGRYAGIKVQIHWTFWLLFVFVAFMVYSAGGTTTDLAWNLVFVSALFFCVILHEFGHALTARTFGVGTRSITLLPIGGLASLKEIPDNPKQEFYIAIAGPLVNVVIALLLYPFVSFDAFTGQEPDAIQEQLSTINAGNFLLYLFFINIALVLFNMLPAFPMDGGRVFRALLSMKMGRVRATNIAASVGKFLAFLFFIYGLFYSVILAVIAVFIYFGAHSENITVQQLGLLEGSTVRDAMITEFTLLNPGDPLSVAVDKILATTEQNFIVSDEEGIQGILYMEDLAQTIRERGRDVKIGEVMDREIRSLKPDAPLANGYKKLQRGNKNFFPVLENGSVVGVVDMNNINEFLTLKAEYDY